MRVLLVDNPPESLEMIRETLTNLEFECVVASPSSDVVALMQERPVDVVFLGHFPPELDGLRLLQDVRKAFPALAVVIHSPRIDIQMACAAVQEKVFALFPETLDLGGFIRILETWARESAEAKERENQHARLALEFAKLKTAYNDLRRGL